MSDKVELLPCPFCGGECDPRGWLRGDGATGPECEQCGATASIIEDWNRRAALSQQPAPAAVPDRWKLVPVEMTPEMIDVALRWGTKRSEWAELLSAAPAAPAPAAQEPVAWQFFQDGRWWNGYDNIPDHRANTEAAGIPTRDLYAAPPAAEQPRMWMAKDERAIRELLAAINRDGGQHQHNVGIAQAACDALEEFDRIRQELAEQSDTVPVPRELLQRATNPDSRRERAFARTELRALLGKEVE